MLGETIKTIAVMDLEANGLPSEQNNTCAITELCIYAFSIENLGAGRSVNNKNEDVQKCKEPPKLPRVLHKLTMMIDPKKKILHKASQMSGLTNDMLSNESPFDENTATCLLSFLERLQKPICLVAHYGQKFDYPVLQHVLKRISKSIPSTIFCIDTFMAFRELHDKHLEIEMVSLTLENDPEALSTFQKYCKIFSKPYIRAVQRPRKGTFVLGNIYERLFKTEAGNMHCAESDVDVLTKVILSYGLPLRAYIEMRKISIKDVPDL